MKNAKLKIKKTGLIAPSNHFAFLIFNF